MIIYDTHAHLYDAAFDEDRSKVIERALSNRVRKIILPNIDEESVGPLFQLANSYPNQCLPMMGLHPCSVKPNWEEQLNALWAYFEEEETHLHGKRFLGVGEIGIDLYWDKTTLDIQTAAFRAQLGWAKTLNRPVAIHVRESFEEVLSVLEEEQGPDLKGILHCFTGTVDQGLKAIDMGFHLGIGGVVTFKNSDLRETLTSIPLDSLVVETDSPYLAPTPHRGKRNEPGYALLVAETIAKAKDVSIEQVARVTSRNAEKLFGL